MKSGTAQKLILNMITTVSMVRMGKVYENVMVDLQMTNKKLEERARRTLMEFGGITYEEASDVLAQTDGHVKTALVMTLASCSAEEAMARLEKSDGFVRGALVS